MNSDVEQDLDHYCLRKIRAANLRYYVKFKKRNDYAKATGKDSNKKAGRPAHWNLDRQFNPYYVRRHLEVYGRALKKAIESETYQPRPCLNSEIPKPGGKARVISQFTLPDASIAASLYASLLERNAPAFSDFAFAFRRDKNAVMAAEYLIKMCRGNQRFFCIEYDFRSFFDEIDHAYLLDVLQRYFSVNQQELYLIKSLLTSRYAHGYDNYAAGKFIKRTSGIPQGCTLSLFLANAVFYELDRDLEALQVAFARYADDIVVLTDTYEKASRAATIIYQFSQKSRIPINTKKSEGIHLITQGKAEIASKTSFTFLGYEISPFKVCLSAKRRDAIKRSLSLIIFQRLLLHPKLKHYNKKRFYKGVDWDLVVCINELRRRIYGRGIFEETFGIPITSRTAPPRSMISSHPLVDNDEDFFELDGWLAGALRRALILRSHLLSTSNTSGLVKPNRRVLIEGGWYKNKELQQDTRLPSLIRAWLYGRKFLSRRGSSKFAGAYESY